MSIGNDGSIDREVDRTSKSNDQREAPSSNPCITCDGTGRIGIPGGPCYICQGTGRLVDFKEAPLRDRVVVACMAGCSCPGLGTKTPDPQYHNSICRYRVLMECLQLLDGLPDKTSAEPTDAALLELASQYDQGPGSTYEFDQETLLRLLRDVPGRNWRGLLETCVRGWQHGNDTAGPMIAAARALGMQPLEPKALTNDQCRQVVAALHEQEWSGISNDDVRLWDGFIQHARSAKEISEPRYCPACSQEDCVCAEKARASHEASRCIHGRVVCEPCAQMAVREHEKTIALVKEIFERHDRVSKLLWGPGSIPGTILGPMDSDAAHADRGRLLSMLTPAQRGTEEPEELPESLRDPVKNLERGRELLAAMLCWCPYCQQPHGVNQTPATDAALARSAGKASAPSILDRKVTVCAACLCACCWQGEFYCDQAKSAGTVEKTIRELLQGNLREDSGYWFKDPNTGQVDYDAKSAAKRAWLAENGNG